MELYAFLHWLLHFGGLFILYLIFISLFIRRERLQKVFTHLNMLKFKRVKMSSKGLFLMMYFFILTILSCYVYLDYAYSEGYSAAESVNLGHLIIDVIGIVSIIGLIVSLIILFGLSPKGFLHLIGLKSGRYPYYDGKRCKLTNAWCAQYKEYLYALSI